MTLNKEKFINDNVIVWTFPNNDNFYQPLQKTYQPIEKTYQKVQRLYTYDTTNENKSFPINKYTSTNNSKVQHISKEDKSFPFTLKDTYTVYDSPKKDRPVTVSPSHNISSSYAILNALETRPRTPRKFSKYLLGASTIASATALLLFSPDMTMTAFANMTTNTVPVNTVPTNASSGVNIEEGLFWSIFMTYIYPWFVDIAQVFCAIKIAQAFYEENRGGRDSGSGVSAIVSYGKWLLLFHMIPFAVSLLNEIGQRMADGLGG